MTSFDDKLSMMAALELPHARRDPQRMGDMLGALLDAMALTVAIAAEGKPDRMSELLDGITVNLIEAASAKAKIAQFIAGAPKR